MPTIVDLQYELTDPTADDLMVAVDDVAGTPVTKKVTLASIIALVKQSIHEVGDVIVTLVNVNPAARYGGTWVQVAQGRTLVGVDIADPDFDAAEKTSGTKTVTLTAAQSGLPAHGHGVNDPGHSHVENSNGTNTGPLRGWPAADASTNSSTPTGFSTSVDGTGVTVIGAAAANAAQAHSNVQPSMTVYFWKRTA